MFSNTNTWALSPRAIFIRIALLLILGVLMVVWIDSHFSPPMQGNKAMVHKGNYSIDTLSGKPLKGIW